MMKCDKIKMKSIRLHPNRENYREKTKVKTAIMKIIKKDGNLKNKAKPIVLDCVSDAKMAVVLI